MTDASKAGRRSRNKGKAGELELAHFLTDRGFPAERAQQFKGGQHSEDIHAPALRALGLHIECKRVERPMFGEWLEKAFAECVGTDKEPLICWRKSKGGWIAVLPLEKLLALLPQPIPPEMRALLYGE